ncbi:hypothetical protein [Sorangium sp. So ce1389]|uniref:hypothetical protein n=1 Tax=Sorangium sp. So ce1389 TaxID=3133336 RepID=UPI003F6253AF
MGPRKFLLFPLVSLLITTTIAAFAQPPAAPDLGAPAAPDPAADALRRARAARSAGRWREAEAAYRAAFAAAPRPAIEGELGLCELSLQEYVDAATHLRRALFDRRKLSPAERQRFEDGLLRAAREVVEVEFILSHPKAEVFLDGRFLGRGQPEYRLYVEPGRHEVRASLEGHATQTVPFERWPGDVTVFPVVLDPIPKPPPPEVIVRKTAPAPERDRSGRNIRIAGASLALAGTALGVGLAIAAGVRDDEAGAQADAIREDYGRGGCLYEGISEITVPCNALAETISARDTMRSAAWASFIAGGVFGVVAISSLWWAPSPPSPPRVVVRPLVAAGGGGVAIGGVW